MSSFFDGYPSIVTNAWFDIYKLGLPCSNGTPHTRGPHQGTVARLRMPQFFLGLTRCPASAFPEQPGESRQGGGPSLPFQYSRGAFRNELRYGSGLVDVRYINERKRPVPIAAEAPCLRALPVGRGLLGTTMVIDLDLRRSAIPRR